MQSISHSHFITVFAILQERNFNVRLATNWLSFEQLGSGSQINGPVQNFGEVKAELYLIM